MIDLTSEDIFAGTNLLREFEGFTTGIQRYGAECRFKESEAVTPFSYLDFNALRRVAVKLRDEGYGRDLNEAICRVVCTQDDSRDGLHCDQACLSLEELFKLYVIVVKQIKESK